MPAWTWTCRQASALGSSTPTPLELCYLLLLRLPSWWHSGHHAFRWCSVQELSRRLNEGIPCGAARAPPPSSPLQCRAWHSTRRSRLVRPPELPHERGRHGGTSTFRREAAQGQGWHPAQHPDGACRLRAVLRIQGDEGRLHAVEGAHREGGNPPPLPPQGPDGCAAVGPIDAARLRVSFSSSSAQPSLRRGRKERWHASTAAGGAPKYASTLLLPPPVPCS